LLSVEEGTAGARGPGQGFRKAGCVSTGQKEDGGARGVLGQMVGVVAGSPRDQAVEGVGGIDGAKAAHRGGKGFVQGGAHKHAGEFELADDLKVDVMK